MNLPPSHLAGPGRPEALLRAADQVLASDPARAAALLREAQRLLSDADLTARTELEAARLQAEHERQRRQQAEATVRAQLAELERARFYDALTGLPNRLLARASLAQALEHAGREGRALALGVLDLDRFQNVNDTFGHSAGDDLLREVARRVAGALDGGDSVARVDGDEFLLLLHDASPQALRATARRVMAALGRELTVEGHGVVLAGSLGLARFPDHGSTPTDLRRAAQLALRDAKSFGGGTEVYGGAPVQRQTDLNLEHGLTRALERGEFELHYQPLVQTLSGAPVTAEALLRWNSPTLGRRPPLDFVPVLERSGLIVPVGDWVLREACRAAARWGGVRVAVNLSARQFGTGGDLPGSVMRALEESGLPGDRLELEITESLMMQSPERAIRALEEIKRAGVRVVLDDFGTGYSSLSYLGRFPLDGVKIDRSFVQGLAVPGHGSGRAVIRAIVQLGAELALDVVAEGVETREQREMLGELGVEVLQGYLFGRPERGWQPS